jgi:hypothetical protein
VTDDISAAQLAAVGTGSFAAHSYPFAPTEVVRLVSDYVAWLFLFDDIHGEGADEMTQRNTLRSYEATLRTGTLAGEHTPFHDALLSITNRARALGADQGWVDRFAAGVAAYLEGCVREVPLRRVGAPPSLAEYRELRLLTVGGYALFDFIELATGKFLHHAPEMHDSSSAVASIARTRDTASHLFGWINDLHSFHKESQNGDPLNLVTVLRGQYGLSEVEAFASAVEVFNLELEVLQNSAAALRSSGVSEALDAYLTGLDDWIHGNLAWTRTCRRYQ